MIIFKYSNEEIDPIELCGTISVYLSVIILCIIKTVLLCISWNSALDIFMLCFISFCFFIEAFQYLAYFIIKLFYFSGNLRLHEYDE